MHKALKKYKKWFIIIGGSVLMIAFLLPNTSHFGGDPRKRAQGTLAGRKVTMGEYGLSLARFKALEDFPVTKSVLDNLGITDGEHFFLAVSEANQAGLVGGISDAEMLTDSMVQQMATSLMRNELSTGGPRAQAALNGLQGDAAAAQEFVTQARDRTLPALIAQAVSRSGLPLSEFDLALADLRGVLRVRELLERAPKASDRRLFSALNEIGNRATIDYVIVPADRLVSSVPMPTEEEIAAHYEKFKAVKASDSPDGIGYAKPDRVRVEWIEINKARVAGAIRLIDSHVRERWNQANPGKTQADFDKERAAFENTLRDEYAGDILRIADGRFREAAQASIKSLPLDGRFRKLPENWRDARLTPEAMAQAIVAGVKAETAGRDDRERWQSPVEIPLPIVSAESALLSQSDLAATPGIGSAVLQRGGERVPFPELALNVRELNTRSPAGVQVGVAPIFDRPVSDAAGNLYYFRVTDVRKAGEPVSLDEVRAAVVNDLRRIRAFEQLKADVQKNLQAAATGGLDAVVGNYPGETTDITLSAPETKPTLPPLKIERGAAVSIERAASSNRDDIDTIDSEPFRKAVMEAFAKLDPRKPLADQPREARLVAAPVLKTLSVVYARVESLMPLTAEMARGADQLAINELLSRETRKIEKPDAPFTAAALRDRLRWVPAGAPRTDEQGNEAETPAQGS